MNVRKLKTRPWNWGFALLLIALIAACGGGGGSLLASNGGGVGSGGTGITFGSITGFGSVIVNGTAYSSATPVYRADTDLGEAAAVPSSALLLGAQVEATLDAQGNPSQILILPQLVGSVQSLSLNAAPGATVFSVNGTAVRVNTDNTLAPLTFYAGLPGLSGLANGDQVEVHGALGWDSATQQPYVLASLIKLLPATSAQQRVSGTVSQLSTSSLQVGALTLSRSGATVLPAGATLHNGDWVNAWQDPTSGMWTIRVRTLTAGSGTVAVSGLVTSIQGSQFALAGIGVDASAAALASSLQQLAVGSYLRVQGSIDSATGLLVATSLQPFVQSAAAVELHGTITGYVSNANFLVRGVAVDASAATDASTGLTVASHALGNGVYVEIQGSAQGNTIVAQSVRSMTAVPTDATADLQGTISSVDSAAHTLVLDWSRDAEGASVAQTSVIDDGVNAALQYVNGSAANLVAGASIEVEGIWASGVLQAYRITFLGQAAPSAGGSGSFDTSGQIYTLDTTAKTFVVNGIRLSYDSSTAISGGQLQNGVDVEVAFDSNHRATAITIDN